MRLWSIHPSYLDAKGLVALWREALLAQKVLNQETIGYRNHPQLHRFKMNANPIAAIGKYLEGIYNESIERHYQFSFEKIITCHLSITIQVTQGQIDYEWQHLMKKLINRDPSLYQKWIHIQHPLPHPIFEIIQGAIETWEIV